MTPTDDRCAREGATRCNDPWESSDRQLLCQKLAGHVGAHTSMGISWTWDKADHHPVVERTAMPMTAPLAEDRLAEWEREHREFVVFEGYTVCHKCEKMWPCAIALLVAEVRRLLAVCDDSAKSHDGWAQRAEQAERERDEARQGEKDACAITGRLARELGEEHAARKGAAREAVPKLIAALREEHKLADELASAVSFLLYPAEQEIREGINREATIKMSVEGVEELRGLTRARAVLTKHAARRGPPTARRAGRGRNESQRLR